MSSAQRAITVSFNLELTQAAPFVHHGFGRVRHNGSSCHASACLQNAANRKADRRAQAIVHCSVHVAAGAVLGVADLVVHNDHLSRQFAHRWYARMGGWQGT